MGRRLDKGSFSKGSVFEEEGVEEAEVTWSIKKRTHCETWKGRLAGLDTTQGL